MLSLLLGMCVQAADVTVPDAGRNAYSHPMPGLSVETRRAHATGNSFFNENWIMAPGSASSRDGLGPYFNARSCSACHPLDGRGSPDSVALLVRMSMLSEGGSQPHPRYGDQIQTLALPGLKPEARIELTWQQVGDLRRPQLHIDDWREGEPDRALALSPRVGNAVFGLGLLEAVAVEEIERRADPEDRDGDGISGRVNRVWDKTSKSLMLGRFGWKANQPTLRQQAADAFLGDIGITSPVNPDEDGPPEIPHGGSPELSELLLQRVTTYLQTLAPPARREVDHPQVKQGERLFQALRCAACHVPELQTAADAHLAELRSKTFHPYTDLLLHDLGEGLADHRPDHEAEGREWRTAPLWGLGLQETVNGHTTLLHDGRARNAHEAILWHGGEATASQEAYQKLSEMEREALLRFLKSL
ncbi:CxxC motif-containing protein, DUF1111 family [Prosthecobacter debontii]|uniref:CxxC motif-containing protein, DUF1111 family n=1 Tax=Prosthecobacter debontii TaxID=48467 RepID=A0A1T4YK59_9BACT|nr:di-heme oxidoredictase family protein [Prosthecobacter debontii]SKB01655.1 CxxC motif-containing protein, DUF1111 family [Prosthecobacter debontii]